MNERNYFKIESKMPSLNDYQAACRANKYTGAKFKEETEKVVLWSLFEAKRAGTLRNVRPEEYPVELRIEWHEKD